MDWQIIYRPALPLTMYRELAAHLTQVEGIKTELFAPTDHRFDYAASQTGGIKVKAPENLLPQHLEIVEAILNHYGQFDRELL